MSDKRKGLIARLKIDIDTRILYENPLLTTPNLSSSGSMKSSIAMKLRSLSKIQQRQFLSLYHNFPDNTHLARSLESTLYLAIPILLLMGFILLSAS